MQFPDHFSALADRYAAYRPRYPRALVDMLARHASGVASGVAWDVGCGNGQLSVALAERFERVIATDPSQAQLDAAEPHPRVEYRRAPAEASGLPPASVGLVVAAQAAHWFDWPRFLAEVERVAVPGALVALVAYARLSIEGEPAATAVVRRYHDETCGPHWPPERRHIEDGYRELVLPWPPVAAEPLELEATWTRDELVGYLSSWSATARLVAAAGAAPFDAMRAELAGVWGEGARRVRWPLIVKLARR